MFPLHVLCVSLSSRNKLPNPPQAPRLCPFGVCFSLLSFCWKPALSYDPRSLSQHRSFSPSLSPPLSLLVKCATSATLFCPSLGTLARAGQWILMSSFRAHSVKARHRDLWIPRLHWHSQSDTLTGPHLVFSPLPSLSLPLRSRTEIIAKSQRRLSGRFVDGGKSSPVFYFITAHTNSGRKNGSLTWLRKANNLISYITWPNIHLWTSLWSLGQEII